LILVLAVISTIGDRRLEEGFITFAGAVLTPNTGGVLMRELERAGTQTGVSVAGVVVLLWGTLRIFRGLDRAFSDIYETEAHNSVADQVADGTLVLLTFCLALVAGWGMNAVLSRYGPGLLVGATRQVVLVFGLAITFFPVYYVFPDTDVTVREVLPGAFVAAIGLTALEAAFRLYVGFKSPESSVVTGILILLTWLYFSGLVVLLGAVCNAVLSNRSRDVSIEPVIGGIFPPIAPRRSPSDASTCSRASGNWMRTSRPEPGSTSPGTTARHTCRRRAGWKSTTGRRVRYPVTGS